jgi:hypothetical protein
MIQIKERLAILQDEEVILRYKRMYQVNDYRACVDFLNRFCFIYEPRNKGPKVLPLDLFEKQELYIKWLWERYNENESGVVDKCRDVGATWIFIGFSVWLMLFQRDISIGLYTYKATECDSPGDMSTLLEKARFMIERLPEQFREGYTSKRMFLKSNVTGSSIAGASGENPSRGGRKTLYIMDECAFYEHAEKVDAAISEVSDCLLYVSTHQGTDTVFYRKSYSGVTPRFEFDWQDNPRHTQEWYDKKKLKAEREGLLHIFKREIDRDPLGSIQNILISIAWIQTAEKNAEHIAGKRIAALDVADDGGDTNAFVVFEGNKLIYLDEWGDGDTGKTAKKAFWKAIELNCNEFVYDAVGVGAGVKATINIILEESGIDTNMAIVPYNAGSKVINPRRKTYNNTENEKLFENRKAQAYFTAREEIYNTYCMIEGKEYDSEKVVCYSEEVQKTQLFMKLKTELAQIQHKTSTRGKLQIDKKPDGTKSPNLADAYVMARAPARTVLKWVK